MNDHELKQTPLWKLAPQFVEEHGDLEEDEFGQAVVDYVARHSDLDADEFVDASVDLYVRRMQGRRHH